MRVERKVMAKDREESKHRPVAGTQAARLLFLQDEPEGQDRENVCAPEAFGGEKDKQTLRPKLGSLSGSGRN